MDVHVASVDSHITHLPPGMQKVSLEPQINIFRRYLEMLPEITGSKIVESKTATVTEKRRARAGQNYGLELVQQNFAVQLPAGTF